MADWTFDDIIGFVLKHEDATLSGAITTDAGGRTRFGIAEKYNPDVPQLYDLPRDEALDLAKRVYRQRYFDPYGLSDLKSRVVAGKLLDMIVNPGQEISGKIAQRALNAIVPGSVTIDGVIGPKTITEISLVDPHRFLGLCMAGLVFHYLDRTNKDPNLVADLGGWIRRAGELPI